MATRRRTLLLAIAELKDVGFLVPKSFNGFKVTFGNKILVVAFIMFVAC